MHGLGYLDYTVEGHASRSFTVMDQFRHQGVLCDLLLHVQYKDTIIDFKVRHPLFLLSSFAYGDVRQWQDFSIMNDMHFIFDFVFSFIISQIT